MALRLFEAFGVELEYMLVHADSLDVLPATDQVIEAVAGEVVSEVERGELAWSNELVSHVIELKTNGPAPALRGLNQAFSRDVVEVLGILRPLGGRLMPTAAHPWMDPARETHIWQHEEYNAVYEAFHRIFGVKGHGWANVQCAHLNIPFHGDDEFARLHAAMRLVLPIIPALAASSPILDGRLTGRMDSRMHFYRENTKKIPSITGKVIPEPVYARRDYEQAILAPMYADIAPHDPEETLHEEWLNSRGAIARFDRSTIEIRIIDIQECPEADFAILHALTCVLRALVSERWQPVERQQRFDTDALNAVLLATTRDAEAALIHDADYLASMGVRSKSATAGEVWRDLVESVVARDADFTDAWSSAMRTILDEGTLSRRIVRAAAGERPDASARLRIDPAVLHRVYERLCDCLEHNRGFHAAP